jgi:hypothetical protein
MAFVAMACLAGIAMAETLALDSRVTAVELFKNGLAIVHRAVEAPGGGTYRIDDLPAPIHGTFWIGSAAPIAARMTMEDVAVPVAERAPGSLQQDLAGNHVTIYFKDGTIPVVTGRVLGVSSAPAGNAPAPWISAAPPAPGNFLVLEVGADRTYVDVSMIAYAHVRAPGDTVTEQRPVLLLEAPEESPEPIRISYLARGMSWAPSYRVDLTDPQTLTIQQQALIKNELEDIDGAEVSLISGFPSIEFAHVTSPLMLSVTWDAFFQQLQQQRGPQYGNAVAMQQMVMSNTVLPSDTFAPGPEFEPQGEGADVHYQPVGARSLKKGDALSCEVARGSAEYTRRVEWSPPESQSNEEWLSHNRGGARSEEESAWEVVTFSNPLPFPMTTGPALVVAGDRILGQNMSYWANSGEPTTVRITKALSIRTHGQEQEVAGTREHVVVGGKNYERTTVEGVARVGNRRAEPVEMVVRRVFSGALESAEGEPETRLLEEGARSVNQKNELTWTFTLAPGEDRVVTYRYTVLVRV